MYMVLTTEGLFEVAIESWPEWDLNPQPLKFIRVKKLVGPDYFSTENRYSLISHANLQSWS